MPKSIRNDNDISIEAKDLDKRMMFLKTKEKRSYCVDLTNLNLNSYETLIVNLIT